MTDRRGRSWTFFSQLLLVFMGIVLLYLMLSFVRQVRVNQQQQRRLRAIEDTILVTLEERRQLERILQEVQSDATVERWGRSMGLARQDEVLVVPFGGSADLSPDTQPVPAEGTGPVSPREAWWDLLFGTR